MARSLRIAVAHDDRELRHWFAESVPKLGHELAGTAQTGRQLVHLVQSARPELVLAGLNLPDMDAIDAARIVHQVFALPFIVVAAEADLSQALARALDSQFLLLLVPPIRLVDLEAAIPLTVRRFEQFQAVRRKATERRHELSALRRRGTSRDSEGGNLGPSVAERKLAEVVKRIKDQKLNKR
ncbi:MAG: response regulator [Gemmataceae bacterium]|nr:response regulator [Gemmataceae bacterium]